MTPQEIARKVGETMFPVDVASKDTMGMERSQDLPRWLHLHPGRFNLCIRLQQLQQERRGSRLQHRIFASRQAR
jgi:uncharacterized protein YpmS